MNTAQRLEHLETIEAAALSQSERNRVCRERTELRKQLGIAKPSTAGRLARIRAALHAAPHGELSMRGIMKQAQVPEYIVRGFLKTGEIYEHRRERDPHNKLDRVGKAIIRAREAKP